MVTKMNKYRMLQRLYNYYRERAIAAEKELSESREEIRKLRDVNETWQGEHKLFEDSHGGITIDWAQRERMMIARNADNSIGRR